MFFLINKPQGISSFLAIKRFAKKHHIKKIGHTGTLDPLATGALLVATNEDTKLIPYVDTNRKTYIARAIIGYDSNSWDITTTYKKIPLQNPINLQDVEIALKSMVGVFEQQPPIFSAKKVNGQRAYKLARANQKVVLNKNKVSIYNINQVKQINDQEYQFTVEVSKGTYIRSIIYELGLKLNTNAIMSKLIRTKISNLKLSKWSRKINVKKIIAYPIIKYSNPHIFLKESSVVMKYEDGMYAIMYKKDIVAIGEIINEIFYPKKILGNKIISPK